jgi:hypothetical protein
MMQHFRLQKGETAQTIVPQASSGNEEVGEVWAKRVISFRDGGRKVVDFEMKTSASSNSADESSSLWHWGIVCLLHAERSLTRMFPLAKNLFSAECNAALVQPLERTRLRSRQHAKQQ